LIFHAGLLKKSMLRPDWGVVEKSHAVYATIRSIESAADDPRFW
jgi:hypothetical protein